MSIVGGVFAAVIIGLLIARNSVPRQPGEDAHVPEAPLLPVSQLTDDPGLSIAYASDRHGAGTLSIWLRPFPSGETRRLTTQAFNDSNPDFSPDEVAKDRLALNLAKGTANLWVATRND